MNHLLPVVTELRTAELLKSTGDPSDLPKTFFPPRLLHFFSSVSCVSDPHNVYQTKNKLCTQYKIDCSSPVLYAAIVFNNFLSMSLAFTQNIIYSSKTS